LRARSFPIARAAILFTPRQCWRANGKLLFAQPTKQTRLREVAVTATLTVRAIRSGLVLLAAFIGVSCAEYIEERPGKKASVAQREENPQRTSICSGTATDMPIPTIAWCSAMRARPRNFAQWSSEVVVRAAPGMPP
jgi:hypothetical protein